MENSLALSLSCSKSPPLNIFVSSSSAPSSLESQNSNSENVPPGSSSEHNEPNNEPNMSAEVEAISPLAGCDMDNVIVTDEEKNKIVDYTCNNEQIK